MIKNILSGIQAYSGSLALISKLKLWKYFLIPVLISFITAITIGLTAYGLSDNFGDFMMRISDFDKLQLCQMNTQSLSSFQK